MSKVYQKHILGNHIVSQFTSRSLHFMTFKGQVKVT